MQPFYYNPSCQLGYRFRKGSLVIVFKPSRFFGGVSMVSLLPPVFANTIHPQWQYGFKVKQLKHNDKTQPIYDSPRN
jgi:hypothetical protein